MRQAWRKLDHQIHREKVTHCVTPEWDEQVRNHSGNVVGVVLFDR